MHLNENIEIRIGSDAPYILDYRNNEVIRCPESFTVMLRKIMAGNITAENQEEAAAVEWLLDTGYVSLYPVETSSKGKNERERVHVSWQTTKVCNLRCAHCFAESSPQHILDVPGLLHIGTRIAEVEGLHTVSFTGGEPLLLGDRLFAAIECFPDHIIKYLLTNGTLITEQAAARIAAAGIDSVQVSIDGDQKLHEMVRGSGAYLPAVAGIKRILRQGVQVQISTTYHPEHQQNFQALAAMISELSEIGVTKFHYSYLFEFGRSSLTSFSCKEFIKCLEFFNATLEGKGLHPGTEPDPEVVGDRPCRAGQGIIAVDHLGRIAPCAPLIGVLHTEKSIADHCLGDLLGEKNMAEFQNATVDRLLECKICEQKYFCGGGCRARAFARHGGLYRKDPSIQCES